MKSSGNGSHKLQPILNINRKRKKTESRAYKINKQMHENVYRPAFESPSEVITMLNRTEKQTNKNKQKKKNGKKERRNNVRLNMKRLIVKNIKPCKFRLTPRSPPKNVR